MNIEARENTAGNGVTMRLSQLQRNSATRKGHVGNMHDRLGYPTRVLCVSLTV